MRVAVTGATGFIGRHLVAHLAARGLDVHAVVRPARRARPIDAIASTDLAADANQPTARDAAIVHTPLARPALDEAFRGANVVVHLAGVVSALHEADYYRVNVDMTRAVAEAAQAAGARL